MSIQPETTLVNLGKDLLKARGCAVIKLHGSVFSRHGEPDLIGCKDGRFFAVEAKQPGQPLRHDQYLRLKEWQKRGAIVGVADCADDFIDIVIRENCNLEEYRKEGW